MCISNSLSFVFLQFLIFKLLCKSSDKQIIMFLFVDYFIDFIFKKFIYLFICLFYNHNNNNNNKTKAFFSLDLIICNNFF